jgi:antitoxin MazE
MQVMVKTWGNSASVRIPSSVTQAAELELDQVVDVREEGGRIVIEPIRQQVYDLATLLAGINDDNLHDAIELGQAVGGEVW